MVVVNDKDESTKEVKLTAGSEINVILPTIKEDLKSEIASAGYTNDSFKEAIRNELNKELTSRGIKPISVEKAETNYIKIDVVRFDRGIGFFRFIPIFGLGNSFLSVNVTISISEGKREIEAQKLGQISGMSQMGDQTKDNIEYVATAVASELLDFGFNLAIIV